jgi:hypothetical protein
MEPVDGMVKVELWSTVDAVYASQIVAALERAFR